MRITQAGEEKIARFWEELFFATFGTPAEFILVKFRRRYRVVNRRGTIFMRGRLFYRGFLVSAIGSAAIKVNLRSVAVPD